MAEGEKTNLGRIIVSAVVLVLLFYGGSYLVFRWGGRLVRVSETGEGGIRHNIEAYSPHEDMRMKMWVLTRQHRADVDTAWEELGAVRGFMELLYAPLRFVEAFYWNMVGAPPASRPGTIGAVSNPIKLCCRAA